MTKISIHIETNRKIRASKLSDLELVALNITAEYRSINFELQLFRGISGTILDGGIERSVYNKRRREFFSYLEKIPKDSPCSMCNDYYIAGNMTKHALEIP